MDKIIVDGETFNPYFMLDVVPDDTENFITKSFRKKAKMWHPDKFKSKDLLEIKKAQIYFKVLVESYEYIINKKKSVNHKNREHINVSNNTNLQIKKIDNSNELELFNEEFDKLHVKSPNDFGYEIDPRLKDTKEYDNFKYKPYKLFDTKQFNSNDFNKLFEYQQQQHGNSNMEISVYHQSTDGFNGYNGGDLGSAASVSSYNGIMIIGDTYGQSGIGYYDANYSDYKKSFESAKNPINKIALSDKFESSTSKKIKPLNNHESQRQIELQMQQRNIDVKSSGHSKQNFKLQEQILLEKQELELKQKLEKDKNMIIQYKHMYDDKSLIQADLL
jgi:curved DNA-binding protein CbpA